MLNNKLNSFMIGSLLGDGYLSRTKSTYNARYTCGHSIKQDDYLKWKFNNYVKKIDPKATIRYCKKDSKGNVTIRKILSKSKSIFSEYYNEWYPEGKKIIPDSIKNITLEGVAIWFMDDGSLVSKIHYDNNGRKFYSGADLTFATHGFSKSDNYKLKSLLEDKFSYSCRVKYHKPKDAYYLYMYSPDKFRFLRDTRKYSCKDMIYKWNLKDGRDYRKVSDKEFEKRTWGNINKRIYVDDIV